MLRIINSVVVAFVTKSGGRCTLPRRTATRWINTKHTSVGGFEYLSPEARDPQEIPEVPLARFLLEQVRHNLPRTQDAPWVIDANSGESVLFSEVEELSRRVACALARLGFCRGDVLFYVTHESALLYLVMLAAWRLGGAVRGAFQFDTPAEYARQLRETRSSLVLVDAVTAPLLREACSQLPWQVTFLNVGSAEVAGAISIHSILAENCHGQDMIPDHEVQPHEDVVLLPNTSGSTGVPKGVMHTHFSTIAMLASKRSCPMHVEPLSPPSSLIVPMNNHLIGTFIATLSCLSRGVTVVHLGGVQQDRYLGQLATYKPSTAMMYPFVATWVARSAGLEEAGGSLRQLLIGGAVLDPTTAELLAHRLPRARITQLYGMTECMAVATTDVGLSEDEEHHATLPSAENQGKTFTSSGKLLPFVQAKVVDLTSGASLPAGERGEVLVRSPTLMRGYLQNDTNKPHRPNIDEDGWFRTGDVGFFDPHGNIYIVERLSFIFKYYMHFVSPTEIEAVLQSHPAVQGAGVVGVPHPETTNHATALVVLRSGHAPSPQLAHELQDHVAAHLPHHKQLHGGLRFVTELPQNRGGKLDRAKLAQMAQSDQF